MLKNMLLALISGLVWVVLTSRPSLESFLVGFVLGLLIAYLMGFQRLELNPLRLPLQAVALVIYLIVLSRDIVLSSIDVAGRVLDPQMDLKLGIIAVDTQDQRGSRAVAALSAHGITITPGEMVVDFDGPNTMYVHSLDVEQSIQQAEQAQQRRLRIYRRILGHG